MVVATEEDVEPEVNMDERLEREGGASGEVQISLVWDDYNDLDLHLFSPSGERITSTISEVIAVVNSMLT